MRRLGIAIASFVSLLMLVPLGLLSLVDNVTALQTRLPSLDSHLLLGTLCGALLMLMADHLLRFAFRRDRQNLLLAGLCEPPADAPPAGYVAGAWIVILPNGYESLHREQVMAEQYAARGRGVVEPLYRRIRTC